MHVHQTLSHVFHQVYQFQEYALPKDTVLDTRTLRCCICQTPVQLFAGVPEPYSIKARANEESAVLVITKADFDDVISHYPEQSDIILTNILVQYGLTRDGEDLGVKGFDQHADEDGYVQLRGAIKV